MPDIASWLSRLGLDKYAEAFTKNEIDLAALPHLSEDDLKELGLPIGPRRRVLAAIAVLADQLCRHRLRRSSRYRFRPEARQSGGS